MEHYESLARDQAKHDARCVINTLLRLRHQADSESLHERDGSIDKLLAAIDKSEKFNEYFPGTGGCYFSMGVTSIDLDNI